MEELKQKFILDFIEKDRWKFITGGLKVTFQVTILALIIGIVIGMILAIIRCAHDQQDARSRRGFKGFLLNLANAIAQIYITVIRGTPVLVQLLIMYFIILVKSDSKLVVAVITFGVNCGAYVAEIFRGGIMSIDGGQMEAGRSVGLSYVQTMTNVVLPQAFKSVLPALINEFIALLKETSICGYIGLNELTRGGDIIRGTTFDALLPLFAVALIYLAIVLLITQLAGILERRLRASDHR